MSDQLFAARVSRDIGNWVGLLRILTYGTLALVWIGAVASMQLLVAVILIPITIVIVGITEVSLVGLRWMRASLEQGEQLRHVAGEQLRMTAAIGTDIRDSTDRLEKLGSRIPVVIAGDLKTIAKESSLVRASIGELAEAQTGQAKLIEEQCQYLSEMATR